MIDWDRLHELREEIGDDAFDEVVAMFLEETDEVIARLSATGGAKALESDLHFLKGSALNLGLADLAALCQDGERTASLGGINVDLDHVRSCYLASKFALDQNGASRAA
jgi:HPt (histidine-containing phosphotransfer) domain-containing protein